MRNGAMPAPGLQGKRLGHPDENRHPILGGTLTIRAISRRWLPCACRDGAPKHERALRSLHSRAGRTREALLHVGAPS